MGDWGCTTGRSAPDCTVGPRSGPDQAPIAPSGPDRAPIAPSGPDCAVGPRSGRDCAVTRSFASESYKAASSATPAVRMVPGRSARILGGCGAVGDIARAYFFRVPRYCVGALLKERPKEALALLALHKQASGQPPLHFRKLCFPAESFRVSAQIGSGTLVWGGCEVRFHEGSTSAPPGFHEFCEGCGVVRALKRARHAVGDLVSWAFEPLVLVGDWGDAD